MMASGRLISFLFAAAILLAACSGGEASEEGDYAGEYWDEEDAADLTAEERAELEAMGIDFAPPQPPAAGAQTYAPEKMLPVAKAAPRNGAANPNQRPAAATPKALPPGAHRVKRFEIIDPNGFERPMTAFTILLPVDWRTQGGVVWGQNMNCGGSGYDVNYAASSPDGRSGLQLMPSFAWRWNNFSGPEQAGGCPFLQITSAQQYLDYLVSQTRPGARVIDFRQRQDLSEPYKMLASNMPMAGGEQRSWVDAGEVLIAYNANGADMRETIAAVVYVTYARMQGGVGMGDMEILSGAAMSAFSMRAPNGQLDFNFAELIRKTVAEAPEWGRRMAQHNAKIAQTNLKGAQDRSRIAAQTSSEILDMQMDSWRRQNESGDRIQRESTEAIMGVETYNDPYYGGTVQLDHTYDNAWQLNDGSYVLTNDAMFEPFRDLGVDGQKLEVTK